jgi:hypothetical protein
MCNSTTAQPKQSARRLQKNPNAMHHDGKQANHRRKKQRGFGLKKQKTVLEKTA